MNEMNSAWNFVEAIKNIFLPDEIAHTRCSDEEEDEEDWENDDWDSPKELSDSYSTERIRLFIASRFYNKQADVTVASATARVISTVVHALKTQMPGFTETTTMLPALWMRFSFQSVNEVPVAESFIRRYSQWRADAEAEGILLLRCRVDGNANWQGPRWHSTHYGDLCGYTLDEIVLGAPIEGSEYTMQWQMERVGASAAKQDEAADKEEMKSANNDNWLLADRPWPLDASDSPSDEPRDVYAVCGRNAVTALEKALCRASKEKLIDGLSGKKINGHYRSRLTKEELLKQLRAVSPELKYSKTNLLRALPHFVQRPIALSASRWEQEVDS